MNKKLIFYFSIFFIFLNNFAATENKVMDPLESIDKTIPPNIVVSVDNSGSMKEDELGRFIYGYFGYLQNTFPTKISTDPGYSSPMYYGGGAVGDFWHFNLPETTFYYDYSTGWGGSNLIPRDDGNWDSSINFSTPQPVSYTYSFVNNSDELIDFIGIGVNVWVKESSLSSLSDISTITLTHDFVDSYGNSNRISKSVPTTLAHHWYYTGQRVYYNYEYYRLYRVKYAFKDFYEYSYVSGSDLVSVNVPKKGNYDITISGSTNDVFVSFVGLSFKPYLSKMTILKTVLQRLFEKVDYARLALGVYKHYWGYKSSSNPLYDNDGMLMNPYPEYAYAWSVNTYDPGFSLLAGWPSSELSIMDNRTELLQWVNMDEIGKSGNFESSSYSKEINAGGGTPIKACLDGVASIISTELGGDSYNACRNYATIFLTDGLCTSGDCDNNHILQTIKNTYESHKVESQGTKTYIVGFALNDMTNLNQWADMGDDGELNSSRNAYAPTNSKELMESLATAIFEASQQELIINSDVVFGTVDPEVGATYNSAFDTKAVEFKDVDGNVIKTETVVYPTIKSNIMFSTSMFYPAWNGSLRAYQPVYQKITSGENADNTELLYFDNNSYPLIWDALEELEKRIEGYDDDSGNYVQGISDALGLTTNVPLNISPNFRKIMLVTGDGSNFIDLSEFTFDETNKKWKFVYLNEVADYFGKDINFAEKFVNFVQTRLLADITNSTPAFVHEPEMGFDDWDEAYFMFKVDKRKNRIPVVLVGANDGMLHAFNSYTGSEVWAVIPYGVKNKIVELVENYDRLTNPSGQVGVSNVDYIGRTSHIYGVASSPKVVDVDLNIENESNPAYKTFAICGLGAGGNSYFAIDITDTLNPVPVWDKTYSGFGETWSYPALWTYRIDEGSKNVGIYTSGYSEDSRKGKTMYVLNTLNGQSLYQISASDGFLYGSPGGILNSSLTSMTGAYFGDTVGNLFRYDIGGSLCKVFQTENKTPIFSTPSILKEGDGTEWVSFGEAGKEDPAASIFATDSKLYTLKYDICSDSKSLVNIETEISSSTMFNKSFPLEGKDGFYYSLSSNEIMFTNPLTTNYYYTEESNGEDILKYEKVSIFVTYKYPISGDACGDGQSQMYIFGISDLFIGDPEEDGDVATVVGEGRPGNPVKTGVTNSVWINSKDGPMRIVPLDNNVTTNSMPLYYYFSGKDARKIGVGSWFVK